MFWALQTDAGGSSQLRFLVVTPCAVAFPSKKRCISCEVARRPAARRRLETSASSRNGSETVAVSRMYLLSGTQEAEFHFSISLRRSTRAHFLARIFSRILKNSYTLTQHGDLTNLFVKIALSINNDERKNEYKTPLIRYFLPKSLT